MELLNQSKIEKEIKELPSGILKILLDAAISVNIKSIAIVGGIVRDIVTKSKFKDYNIIFNDLDLVIEGESTKYIEELQKNLGANRVKVIRNNKIYKTSEITIDGIKVDIASAREESYPIPGENPVVESSTIKKDLFRRDFNINAMAFELKGCKIIDLFNGLNAISNMRLDFLHDLSVLEDPTRIIRASRYSAKLGFNLSNKSLRQIQDTLFSWPWNWHIGDNPDLAPSALSIRLRMELELLFASKDWKNALNHLQEWGALNLIDTKLQNDKNIFKKILIAKQSNIDPLTAFIYETDNPLYLAERLQLSHKQKEIVEGACKLNKYLDFIRSNELYENWSPSKWTTVLEGINANESSFLLEICRNNHFKKYLVCWLNNWKHIKSPIKGDDLINQGWESGPGLGIEIKRQRMKLIDEKNII